MPPSRTQRHQENSARSSPPISAQKYLFMHWVLRMEALNRLAENSEVNEPPDRKSESIAEWMRKAQKYIDESNRLLLQIKRIQSYLGRNPKSIDPKIVETANWIATARWARALIQNGESDEAVARFLKNSAEGQKRGRPSGAMNCDGQALRALVLHDSNPKWWTWPKLADRVLGCKVHTKHTSDSNCTAKLKQAVTGLRKFLRELESEFTVK